MPFWVKKIALVFDHLFLLCSHERPVFSPALKMYFPDSNWTTTVGSESAERVDIVVADQSMGRRSECFVE